MNFRKFYLIVCSLLSVFMFFMGILALLYISFSSEETINTNNSANGALIHEILIPYKQITQNINILLLCGDVVNSNTDTIMLVNFNPSSAKVRILSIPRDTKVLLGGKTAKINAAYPKGGGELAVQTVEDLLGVEVNHYVFINTSVFRNVIDKLGGVDYYIPVNMDYDDPLQNLHIHFKKGNYHFTGIDAEKFMRYRQNNNSSVNKYYDGSDLKRIDAQQNFIKEVVRQKANVLYIAKIGEILDVVFNSIDTDMNINNIMKLSSNIGKINADEIESFKLPGESLYDTAWYYIMDKNEAQEITDTSFGSKKNE